MSTEDQPDWWKNIGGQNSQDSILERRSLIWNDNGIENGTVPPFFTNPAHYTGKFFTRGCRGMLEQIQLYCIGDGVDEITIRYSPHPGLGPLGEVTIVPAAGWAWQNFIIEAIWNYDSLFIWVHEVEANVDLAWDLEQPYDGHQSGDAGVTWGDLNLRQYVRGVYTGETPGDVPVSGIVNNIEIPNLVTEEPGLHALNIAIVGEDFYLIEGAGWISYALWYVATDLNAVNIAPRLRLDGCFLDLGNISMISLRANFFQNSVEGWSFPRWDAATHRYCFQLVRRIPFRRTCEIGFTDCSGNGGGGYVWPLVELLV